jgi:hypothetical protein
MELSEKDKKKLDTFSKYIRSWGSKVAKTVFDIDWDKDFYRQDFKWIGDTTSLPIDSYDIIDDLIEKLVKESNILDKRYSDDNWYLNVVVNTNERTVTFFAEIPYLRSKGDIQEFEITQDEGEEIYKWFNNLKNEGYEYGTLHYEGGGDDGYLEDFILWDDGDETEVTNSIEDYFIEKLSFYNWYDNEGGQGNFYIKIPENKITLEWEENFDDYKEIKIDTQFTY